MTQEKRDRFWKGVASYAIPFLIVALVVSYTLNSPPPQSATYIISDNSGIHESTWVQIDSLQKSNPVERGIKERIQLGHLILQAVRESSRTELYSNLENLLEQISAEEPDHPAIISISAQVDLTRHEFEEAYRKSELLTKKYPATAAYYGLMVDSLVELGRYEEALQTLEKMIELKPDSNTQTRAAFLREIYGDTEGAIELMEQAILSSPNVPENLAWNYSELGELWAGLDKEKSLAAYTKALQIYPGFRLAEQGMANHLLEEGKTEEAIKKLESLLDILPRPHIREQIGDIYRDMGDSEQAESFYREVEADFEKLERLGNDVKLERAEFAIMHGRELEASVKVVEEIFETHPSVFIADLLAWGYHQVGEQQKAQETIQQALRTGIQNEQILEHAQAIRSAG